MTTLPHGRFEVVARHRPIALVATPRHATSYQSPPSRDSAATPYDGPGAAIELELGRGTGGRITAHLSGPGETRVAAVLDGATASLTVRTADGTQHHRSRRHGRARAPDRLALTLTGTHATAFTHEGDRWVARARTDLADRVDTRDAAWLAGLVSGWGHDGAGDAPVLGWRAGPFGQVGLRDLRLVTEPDGTPYRPDGHVLFSATSAGPGFFDTAHTSLWRIDPHTLALEHASDLWFTRPDRPGVYGDHATHVVHADDGWLVATSTWGDFVVPEGFRGSSLRSSHLNQPSVAGFSHINQPSVAGSSHLNRRRGVKDWVDVTLAETDADITTGTHVLATRPLPLPTDGLASVGAWDPHLVRTGDGWLVGFVSARAWFDFHPVIAEGPTLADLRLRAAATERSGTEGTTLWPSPDGWQVLASDGPANPRSLRRRYPVLDLDLDETGTLDAPYFSNIGWPTLVPPLADEPWLMLTFDGDPAGGRLPGYGTHGNLLVLQPRRH